MNNLALDLRQFTGTEKYYCHALNPKFLWTDGVDYFADKAKAFWFIDAIALGVYGRPGIATLDSDFAVVLLKVKNEQALLEAYDDIPGRCLYSENIEYTDCPDGEWKFYLSNSGSHIVLMVPSEY